MRNVTCFGDVFVLFVHLQNCSNVGARVHVATAVTTSTDNPPAPAASATSHVCCLGNFAAADVAVLLDGCLAPFNNVLLEKVFQQRHRPSCG
jgi:hypothetical protein